MPAGPTFATSFLPNWTVRDAWGRNFWDWECYTADLYGTEYSALYMMQNKDYFQNWRNDVRNILALFMHMAGVESLVERRRSITAPGPIPSRRRAARPLSGIPRWRSRASLPATESKQTANGPAKLLAALRSSPPMTPRKTARRMDVIEGGVYVNKSWFKIAHPMALRYVLRTMAWLPGNHGPNRENHIMRSSAVVNRLVYDKGRVAYSTFDAPANSVDVLRLAFAPSSVEADGATAQTFVGSRPLTDIW